MKSSFNIETTKNEIIKAGFALSESEVNDFSHIAETFNDQAIVTHQLLKLEKLLQYDLDTKKIYRNSELILKFINPMDSNKFKVLSDTLYQWAIQNNFGNIFAKISRYLSPSEFQSILRQGVLFKDIGVPPKHGAWTHFIQWFILVEAHNDKNYLSTDPVQLYKILGETDRAAVSAGNRTLTLWDLVFDIQSNDNKYDFRSPDNLHAFILNSTEFPCLRIVLSKGFSNINVLDSRIQNVVYKNYEDEQSRLIGATTPSDQRRSNKS